MSAAGWLEGYGFKKQEKQTQRFLFCSQLLKLHPILFFKKNNYLQNALCHWEARGACILICFLMNCLIKILTEQPRKCRLLISLTLNLLMESLPGALVPAELPIFLHLGLALPLTELGRLCMIRKPHYTTTSL